MCFLSIVIPVYNMGNLLEKSVIALLNQDFADYEIILVDDGSNDNSLEVCNNLKQKSEKIQVIHTENHGSGPARNEGIRAASGKYIYFPDADDYTQPDALSIIAKTLVRNECDTLVFGYESRTDDDTLILRKEYPIVTIDAKQARMNYSEYMDTKGKYYVQGAPWNKVFSMSVIRENAVFFPSLRRHQDDAFISMYMCHAERITFIPDVLYVHYLNDLRKEWDKYPLDYFNYVEKLYEIRCNTILQWNKDDVHTRQVVRRSYICNTIKAMELQYSDKANFDHKQRIKEIQRINSRAKLTTEEVPTGLGKYQKTVLWALINKHMRLACFIMLFKIQLEKLGVVAWIKRVISA